LAVIAHIVLTYVILQTFWLKYQPPLFSGRYVVVPPATGCEPGGQEITTVEECAEAARSLGVKFSNAGSFPRYIRNCRYEDVIGSPVKHITFNTFPRAYPPARPHPDKAWAQAVCQMPGKSSPHTGDATASLKEFIVLLSVVEIICNDNDENFHFALSPAVHLLCIHCSV